MTTGVRLLLHSLLGVVMGVCVVVIAVAACLLLAFSSAGEVTIPGVIAIWQSTENDAIALNVTPRPWGLLLAVLGVAATVVALRLLADRRRARKEQG